MHAEAINSGHAKSTTPPPLIRYYSQLTRTSKQRGFNSGASTQFGQFENAAEYGDSIDAWESPLWFDGNTVDDEAPGARGHGHYAPVPQNYDPRIDFRDYALQLSTNGQPNDCLKLELLAYKAGQVFSDAISGPLNGLTDISGISQGNSDPNYRVGVLRRDPYFGNSFSNSGFLPRFQDTPPGNQVRHFVG